MNAIKRRLDELIDTESLRIVHNIAGRWRHIQYYQYSALLVNTNVTLRNRWAQRSCNVLSEKKKTQFTSSSCDEAAQNAQSP